MTAAALGCPAWRVMYPATNTNTAAARITIFRRARRNRRGREAVSICTVEPKWIGERGQVPVSHPEASEGPAQHSCEEPARHFAPRDGGVGHFATALGPGLA